VDLGAAVVAHEQPLEVMQPGEGALDDPADAAEAGAMLGSAAGYLGADAAPTELAPVPQKGQTATKAESRLAP
jgi:hypothetical protein